MRRTLRISCWLIALGCFALTSAQAQTIDHSVSSSETFRDAIAAVNADPTGAHRILITGDFTLGSAVQAIDISGSLTVVGNGHTIDGGAAFRPFFIEGGEVALENLTLANGLAKGGNGGGGAGGGLGAGGAVFVDTFGSLRLKNVRFAANSAVGGAGGAGGIGGGGGGGLGGNGGELGGGGGGLHGNGGSGDYGLFSSGGGGGGQLTAGGNGDNSGNGGGGGAVFADGADGNGSNGGAGGDGTGGNGGDAFQDGADGSDGGGGGGAGGYSSGGSGGLFGGGGGGRVGGRGGDFGGGGGSSSGGSAGDGGFGGGGGSGHEGGGNGGFGAGGGAGYSPVWGLPGSGGFGGGNASPGGIIGGAGTYGSGGGGAAFGGALFVAAGATIVVENDVAFTGNQLTAGESLGDGGMGSEDGVDLYLMSGTTAVFDIGPGATANFAPSIGNDDGVNYGVELIKDGAGTLVLTGDSPWVSSTYVDRGSLVVNGSLGSFDMISGRISMLSVEEHGTLAGTGTVRGFVDNYGRIAPGATPDSIGTLQIDGVYQQGSEGVYEVDINAAGQSDRIDVSYFAFLTCGCGPNNSQVAVKAAAGDYSGVRRYTILTAEYGVVDTFGQLSWTGLGAFATVFLEYDEFNVYLVVDDRGLIVDARTFNQTHTAGGVMNALGSTDTSFLDVVNALKPMSADERNAALDQLSGELFGSLTSVGFQCTENFLGGISSRLRPNGGAFQSAGIASAAGGYQGSIAFDREDEIQLVSFEDSVGSSKSIPLQNIAGGSAPRRTRPQHYGWVGGYGLGGAVTNDGNAQGFSYGFGGTTFGVDRSLGNNTIVGLAGGYVGSRILTDNRLQSGRVNSLQGGLYATRVMDDHYAFGIVGYSDDDYTTSRQLPGGLTANGRFGGHQFTGYAESGLLRQWGAWNWQPSLAAQYIGMHQNTFLETGAGGAGLLVDANNTDSFRGIAGLRFTRPLKAYDMTLIPTLSARYGREFCGVDRLVTANFAGANGAGFTTAGNQLGRNFGQLGAGVNAAVTRNVGAFAGYDLMTADRAVSHSGNGGVQVTW